MEASASSQAILYAAKSTEDIRGSIPGQLQEARAFARDEDLEVAAEYSEEDVSAYTGNRGPGLAAALEHAERINGVLIAQHSDRLARGDGMQARHLVEIALWARKSGVRVHCIQDPSTFDSLVLAAAMGERNMEDSRRKSAAVKAGIARRRLSGRPVGPHPFGYTWRRNRRDEREIVPDPDRAPVIERIYSEYLAGRPQLQIARALTADRISTARGGKWKPEVVRVILTNPIYAGLIRCGETLVDARHKPIIPRDRWEEAQALRAAKAKTKECGRSSIGLHLFRKGFLRCGECGEAMITRSARNSDGSLYETYRCHGHYLDPGSCPMAPQRREPIDAAVYSHFKEVGLDMEAVQAQILLEVERRTTEVQALLEEAEREAGAAVERLARIKKDYVEDDLSAAEWRELKADLEPEVDASEAERERLEEQLASVKERPDVSEAEAELQKRLAAVCTAIVGGAGDATEAAKVRNALLRLFDCFVLHCGMPDGAQAKLCEGELWIEPVMSELSLDGYEEKIRLVLFRRSPYGGEAARWQLLGPIAVGAGWRTRRDSPEAGEDHGVWLN